MQKEVGINYKEIIASLISNVLIQNDVRFLSKVEILESLETPPSQEIGDYAFPCYSLSRKQKKAPNKIAEELSVYISNYNNEYISKVEPVGPYINFFFSKQKLGQEVIQLILEEGKDYGNLSIGNEKNITIDFSSPNIAKPFSVGHLRSTVIGNALANIAEKSGYNVIRINHLGDWGTQFGKLITAYKMWGNEEVVRENPIKELLKLYVRFHKEAEENPLLEGQARFWLKELESGNEKALSLWKWFREESLKEFEETYQLLGIEFDSFNGESFYNDKVDKVVQELEAKDLLLESDGAMIVPLDEFKIPPCLIKKSDGATLYATRDLAAAIYRKKTYDFTKSLYVVGDEQSLHFRQMIKVLHKMGYKWADDIHHIPFGMMLKNGKKMSTRKGKTVLLEEVFHKAIQFAKKGIEIRNPNLENKGEVANAVGVGAVVFHDLKNSRQNDIEFSFESMLTFEGETGPYIQYTYVRACSILKKVEQTDSYTTPSFDDLESKKVWGVISLLMKFPAVIQHAMDNFDPSHIAKYAINLAQAFNRYYGSTRILEDDEQLGSRIKLVEATRIVLRESLRILGIKAPEQM